MTRITFEEISLYGRKSVKCLGGCGRRLTRQKTFMQTLNPFNRLPPNLGGDIKTAGDIQEELNRDRIAWLKKPETCIHCQKKE